MKKLTVAIICLFCLVTFTFAKPNDDVFQKMTEPQPNLPAGARAAKPRFNVVSDSGATVSVSPDDVAIKIWFTDASGNPYHPSKHRFNPKERFNIWMCSNTPVIVSLFQNYPNDILKSRLVYPVQGNPATYQPLKAFVPVKVPVSFEMDDNMNDEIMSIVVSKGGAEVINNTITTIENGGNTQTVIVNGDNNGQINMNQESVEMLVRFNQKATQTGNAAFRFTPCTGTSLYVTNTTTTGETTTTVQECGKDVCSILFGHGNVAQHQLTLHK